MLNLSAVNFGGVVNMLK